jgi:hypothetical protein
LKPAHHIRGDLAAPLLFAAEYDRFSLKPKGSNGSGE